ncbi:MAG: hypothetical protein HYX81_01920 [Chloroflexi bacterium]|nr:hypothetical protein [Chloroflexota bacterium]
MQLKKTYQRVNPELLYAEIRDFVQKQGAVLGDSKLETYALPEDSSTFITRATLIFKTGDGQKECLRAHVVGTARSDTKLMLDIDDQLFPPEKTSAFQADLDFIFGSFEVKKD